VSLHETAALPYELAEELASDARYRLCRGRIAGGTGTVLLKVPAHGPAQPEDVAGLKHEYEILHQPPIDAVTRALDLVCDDRFCALVLEDREERPLASLIAARSTSIGWVLDYALQIVGALAGLHRAGVVHRGLSPRSVLVHAETGRIRLTDFADAARNAAEALLPLARHQYRTRLPYAAPEQTGRINRACDYRTDFYSLGALLYELLIGRPPFVADDPIELMHAHLARQPVAPSELVAAVPLPLSEIVLKLLAKQPEERYQSARALADDLDRCRREWTARGRVAQFPLAARDVSDRFSIPNRLFGREAERAELGAAFERVRNGASLLVLVEGAAGIGKTALIRELQGPVSRSRGHFVSGKFDQLSRDVPYGALSQALRQRIQQTLTATPLQMAHDRERIASGLGAHAAVIAELVPELVQLLGAQPPAPRLPAAEVQNRFTLAFRNFIATLATAAAPLVIFLDDLQWADTSTLHLLTALLDNPASHHLLLIGAYRSAPAAEEEALAKLVAEVESGGVPVQRLLLGPLAADALRQFAEAALQRDDEQSARLARVLQEKTLGNPFFVTQLLVALQQDGAITFDRQDWTWTCRTDLIEKVPVTDNVVDLLARKLDRLPASVQRVLTLAACVGNRFDVHTLATVCELPLRAIQDELDTATRAGLIATEAGGVFVFLHDRVQQAAYARIDPADRPRVHLRVGRLLWAEHAEDGSDIGGFDGIFETASHLNLGAQEIDDRGERLALARLNRAAGAKAKAAAAYRAALGYFAAGRALLEDDHWRSAYPLAFELHFEAAQCEYLCGNFDAAAHDFDALLVRAATPFDRARVVSLRAIHHENLGRYEDALASGREALALLDVLLPSEAGAKQAALAAEIAAIDARLDARAIASLIDLPVMTDPVTRLVMRILVDAWSPAYILGDATLARLLSATLVRLSLEHGNTEESAYGYVTHAITAGPVRGDYAAAGAWGALAIAVNTRFDDRRLRAKIYQQFHAHVALWRSPFALCVEHAKQACRSGLESGDFLYAAYGAATESWPGFAAAQDLVQYVRELEPNLSLLLQLKNPAFADALRLMMAWARALQVAPAGPIALTAPEFDEHHYVATYRDNPFFSMFHAIARLHVCYTLDDLPGAARAAAAVSATAASLTGMLWSVQFEFWNGMRLAAGFADASPAHRAEAKSELQVASRSLAALAESCPENYRCFALLLQAELARVSDQPFDALQSYEQAVTSADAARHVQQQALANERCGRFWHERGNRKVAALYLQAALEHYARWGAHAKVRTLLAAFPGLLRPASASLHDAVDAPPRSLPTFDVATLGRAAQAITETDQLGAALRQMLSIAIQNAGASRGVLIEVRDGELFVLAEGDAETHATISLSDVPVHMRPPRCSSAIVNAVLRAGNHVIAADPALDSRFAHDEYLAAHRPRAVLCVVAMHQSRPAAMMYLENRFARDAFNDDRVDVIQILAAQAALSLVGARMLEQMKREMAERQRAEQQLRAIDEGLASVTGGDFFRALVRNVAQALQVRYAFIAECVPATTGSGRVARACAFWNGDGFGPTFEYNLAGTPCQQVVEGKVCHFASDLQAQFPADRALVRWDAQSYIGMPLVGSNDEVIGHLVVLDTAPMTDATTAISLLRLSAGRAGAELERLKADQGLQRALAEVEQLKNRLQEENVYLRRELIANVSHDLRSPLASLRGYLETLLIKEQTLSASDRRSYLSIAARQAEHLQALISELFDLARLDFAGYRIAAEPLHLGELARDVMQKFQLAAEEKAVDLQLDVDDALGLVDADIGLMERTLENLLGNALAHTPGQGRVRLAAIAGHDGVTIDVSDTGVGIPPDDLPRIFERFYRVDKARSLASQGSGLGLAIVKRIVELHGSEIRVESEVGVGTRFWFTLKARVDRNLKLS
jgi:predicted ATPase/signal transduction histidine kinase